MKNYNDELLNPSVFEKMAKEYALNMNKNFKFIKINTNTELKHKTEESLNYILQNLTSNINNLSSYNLKNCYKKNLDRIKEILNAYNLNGTNCTTNKNYCECLNKVIHLCTDAILNIRELNNFLIDEDLTTNIIEIIKICTNMFGVCKYRK